MATRAHLREQVASDKIGALAPVALATVAVYQVGTTTPVTGTLYSTATGVGTLTNPLTANASGLVEFWMTNAQQVDLAITAAGYDAATVTAQVIGTDTATGIMNLNTTTTPAVAGDVQINGESLTYEGTTTLHTADTLDQAQTITGAKTATALTVADPTDNTKALNFSLSGATTGKTATLASAHTLARTHTLPDNTGTVAELNLAQNFTALQEFSGGVSPNGTNTLTLPAATDTLVGKATADTLTNKTLTGPRMDVIKDTAGATVQTITAGGGVQVGTPTGGDKGAGALNAAGLYVNGAAVGPSTFLFPIGTSSSGLASGTAYFWGNQNQATDALAHARIEAACTLTAFGLSLGVAPGGATSYAFTVMKNNAATALTFSVTGAATTGEVTATVSVAKGDTLSVQVVSTGAVATSECNGTIVATIP